MSIQTNRSLLLTRDIQHCLAPCSECTGVYVDSVTESRLKLVCKHSCHTITKNVGREDESQPTSRTRSTNAVALNKSTGEDSLNDYEYR
jgi:hypothetical protein